MFRFYISNIHFLTCVVNAGIAVVFNRCVYFILITITMSNNFGVRFFFLICFFVAAGALVSCNHPKAAVNTAVTHKAGATADPEPRPVQHGPNPYPFLPQRDFTRLWNGAAYCNKDTVGVAASLNLTSKDSMDVYVTGFYNSKSKVEARIRGYMVLIKPQNIHLPEGDRVVEGSFVLSNDRNTLKGFYTTQSNGKIDSCRAVFHSQR